MLMPVQMLSTTPADDVAVIAPAMPCHHAEQMQANPTDTAPETTQQHCPGCDMQHTALGDGCDSCSCANLGSVLSTQVELLPLSLPLVNYADHYLFQFSSISSLPILRPPKSV